MTLIGDKAMYDKELEDKKLELFDKMGKLYYFREWKECIAVLDELIPLSPDDDGKVKLYKRRAHAKSELGDTGGATADYDRAGKLIDLLSKAKWGS